MPQIAQMDATSAAGAPPAHRRIDIRWVRRLFARRPPLSIIHTSADSRYAGILYDRLRSWGYRDVFLDFEVIPAGEYWEQVLFDNILRCRAALAVVTGRLLTSEWCQREIQQVLPVGKILVPIIYEGEVPDRLNLGKIQCAFAAKDPTLPSVRRVLDGLARPLHRTLGALAAFALLTAVAVVTVRWHEMTKRVSLAKQEIETARQKGWEGPQLTDHGSAAVLALDDKILQPYERDGIEYAIGQLSTIAASDPQPVCRLFVGVFTPGRVYGWGLAERMAPLARSVLGACGARDGNALRTAMAHLYQSLEDVLDGDLSLSDFWTLMRQLPENADRQDVVRLCRAVREALGKGGPCGN
jgi:TIR domain